MEDESMKPILFLDIDGVLVTAANWIDASRQTLGDDPPVASPVAVAALNRILREAGAQIVVSSSWRKFGRRYLDRCFARWKVQSPIFSMTPDMSRQQRVISIGAPRWLEIDTWLRTTGTPRKFVILDDEHDMGPLQPYLIQSTFQQGLTEELADKAIAMLSLGVAV
jgi:hypothetical protein